MFRLGRHRHMQRDHVRRREQSIQRHLHGAGNICWNLIRVGDGHTKGWCLCGHRASDAADTDEAELLASQFHTKQVVKCPAAPRARTHLTLTLAESARNCENEAPGEIRTRVGEHVRRVGHNHAARSAGRQIDVVVADRNIADRLQLRPGGVEHGRIDRFGEQAHDGVLAGHPLQQLFP
jgi:hypothetical protein